MVQSIERYVSKYFVCMFESNLLHQGSAWDGTGRKKWSHGTDEKNSSHGTGPLFKIFRPMGRDHSLKYFRPMGRDDFKKFFVPSHPIPCNCILIKYRLKKFFAHILLRLKSSNILLFYLVFHNFIIMKLIILYFS
jgi:hypothetical protein